MAVVDPVSGRECPRARFDAAGRLGNADQAVGELVGRNLAGSFERYFENPQADAERVRHGWYWSGDLAYRDQQGWFYFAGRAGDWLRVDSERFAAAPLERILGRFAPLSSAAVYPVPDPRTGDQVMAALELVSGALFVPETFGAFLGAQGDLGTTWAPRFVRIVPQMPLTASLKVRKALLRQEAWRCADPVYWQPGPRGRPPAT